MVNVKGGLFWLQSLRGKDRKTRREELHHGNGYGCRTILTRKSRDNDEFDKNYALAQKKINRGMGI